MQDRTLNLLTQQRLARLQRTATTTTAQRTSSTTTWQYIGYSQSTHLVRLPTGREQPVQSLWNSSLTPDQQGIGLRAGTRLFGLARNQ
jgi:glucose dehydrogenase